MSELAVVGFVLAFLALAFVLYPVVRPSAAAPRSLGSETADLEERRQALYRQILEIEFDQRVGKLDPDDARQLISDLLRQAATLLARESAAEREVDEQVEREIANVRRAMAELERPVLDRVGP